MSAHYTRVKSVSLDVIEDRVYHYVKKNPQTSLLDVASHTGLMEFQVKKAWRNLAKTGELPSLPYQRTQAKKVIIPQVAGKSPGRPVGMTGAIAAQVLPRECNTIAAFLMKNPGTSVRAIAKHTGLATWRVYRARKVMEKIEEVAKPPRWGKGRQHATYTNFLLTVLAPV
jgi:hypothetical protein